MFFTFSLIIVSSIPLLGIEKKASVAIIQVVLIVLLALLSFVGILMLKEPRDDAKTFPNFKSKQKEIK